VMGAGVAHVIVGVSLDSTVIVPLEPVAMIGSPMRFEAVGILINDVSPAAAVVIMVNVTYAMIPFPIGLLLTADETPIFKISAPTLPEVIVFCASVPAAPIVAREVAISETESTFGSYVIFIPTAAIPAVQVLALFTKSCQQAREAASFVNVTGIVTVAPAGPLSLPRLTVTSATARDGRANVNARNE